MTKIDELLVCSFDDHRSLDQILSEKDISIPFHNVVGNAFSTTHMVLDLQAMSVPETSALMYRR